MSYTDQLREWCERRAAILAHFKESGSLSETGRAFHLSRQRIAQIVQNSMEGKDGPPSSDREVLGGNLRR